MAIRLRGCLLGSEGKDRMALHGGRFPLSRSPPVSTHVPSPVNFYSPSGKGQAPPNDRGPMSGMSILLQCEKVVFSMFVINTPYESQFPSVRLQRMVVFCILCGSRRVSVCNMYVDTTHAHTPGNYGIRR